jgi:hypothetical protein
VDEHPLLLGRFDADPDLARAIGQGAAELRLVHVRPFRGPRRVRFVLCFT